MGQQEIRGEKSPESVIRLEALRLENAIHWAITTTDVSLEILKQMQGWIYEYNNGLLGEDGMKSALLWVVSVCEDVKTIAENLKTMAENLYTRMRMWEKS